MNRRNTIKTLMMATTGLVALPAWANEWTGREVYPALHPAFLAPDEEAIMSAVADTIIPAWEGIGALDVEVDAFLLRLFADCYEPEVQQNLKLQFRALEASATNAYGKPFAACNQLEREQLLLAMASSEIPSQADFFKLVKGETIRGFLTSRKVMRDYFEYVVAPGFYYGCVDLNAS